MFYGSAGSGWQKLANFWNTWYLVKDSCQRTQSLLCGQAVIVGQFGSYQEGWRGTVRGKPVCKRMGRSSGGAQGCARATVENPQSFSVSHSKLCN